MDFLTLNLINISFILPFYSMIDPDFTKFEISTKLESCISSQTINDVELCNDNDGSFMPFMNRTNNQFLLEFEKNINK